MGATSFLVAATVLVLAAPEPCQGVQGRAVASSAELSRAVPAAERAAMEKAVAAEVANGKKKVSVAWKRAYAGAVLARRPATALWAASRGVEVSGDGATTFAMALVHAGKVEEAAVFAACGKAREPKSPVPLEVQARAAWLKNEDGRAKELLHAALALSPRDAELQYALGLVYARLGERETAVEWLRRASAAHVWDRRMHQAYDELAEEQIRKPPPGNPAPAPTPPRPSIAKVELLVEEATLRLDEIERAVLDWAAWAEPVIAKYPTYGDVASFTQDVQRFRENLARTRRGLRDSLSALRTAAQSPKEPTFTTFWNAAVASAILAVPTALAEAESIRDTARGLHLLSEASRIDVRDLAESGALVRASGGNIGLSPPVYAAELLGERLHGLSVGWKRADEALGEDKIACAASAPCKGSADPARCQACWDAAVLEHCRTLTPLYTRAAPVITQRVDAAVAGFERVARFEVRDSVATLDDVVGFAARGLAIARPAGGKKKGPLPPELKAVAQAVSHLLQGLAAQRSMALQGLMSDLDTVASTFDADLEALQRIVEPCGKAEDRFKRPTFSEELAAVLEALKTGEVSGGLVFDCEVSLGPFIVKLIEVSPDGGWEAGGGGEWTPKSLKGSPWSAPIGVEVKGPPGAPAPSVEITGGVQYVSLDLPETSPASIKGAEGLAAEVNAKLRIEPRSDGSWDARVGAEGKLGVGLQGGGIGGACYFLQGQADVSVRTFWETYRSARTR